MVYSYNCRPQQCPVDLNNATVDLNNARNTTYTALKTVKLSDNNDIFSVLCHCSVMDDWMVSTVQCTVPGYSIREWRFVYSQMITISTCLRILYAL